MRCVEASEEGRRHTLAGALEAAAGALAACEEGALEATDDLGGYGMLAMNDDGAWRGREGETYHCE